MTDTSAATLCTGIGGIDLGLERAGWEIRWQAEVEPYCCDILKRHWPAVPNHGDIKNIDWSTVEPVTLVCAGYPCQPFSLSGVRGGENDPRHLWPWVRTALGVLRPRMVLLENVPGHLGLGFDAVLADLADLGFDAEWSLVPACAFGASHTRDRLLVLAHAQGDDGESYLSRHRQGSSRGLEPRGGGRRARRVGWLPEPQVGRVAHGFPRRLVTGPLHALGNAVVPQVAEWAGHRLMAALSDSALNDEAVAWMGATFGPDC